MKSIVRKLALAVGVVATGACATGGAGLFSTEAAFQESLGEMCAPVVVDGASMDEIASAKRIAEVDPVATDASGQSNRTWLLPTISETQVTMWADGSCMVSVNRRGDSEQLAQQAVAILRERGLDLRAGAVSEADRGGLRSAFCTPGSYPYFLAVTVPGASGDRPPMVATLMKAGGERPSFC